MRKDLLEFYPFPETFTSKGYSRFKSKLLKERGHKCNRCDATKNLTLHHINHCTSDNNPANLEVLCRTCHDLEDFGKITPNGKYYAGLAERQCGDLLGRLSSDRAGSTPASSANIINGEVAELGQKGDTLND